MSNKLEEVFGVADFSSWAGFRDTGRAFSAEIIGTYFLVFFGCGAAVNFGESSPVDVVRIRYVRVVRTINMVRWIRGEGEAALHRGSVSASHPAILGLIPSILKIFLILPRFINSAAA